MRIRILGTESLGVPGLCCLVEAADRRILFDPGVSLGYRRHGLLPHPVQVAAGERVREEIVRSIRDATDVVISHFHGDHMPLVKANPYQLPADSVAEPLQSVRLWTKGVNEESERIRERVGALTRLLQRELPNAEGQQSGPLAFSEPVPHGQQNGEQGNVMMTRVQHGAQVFVHASDLQLLNEEGVRHILRWEPTVVLVSGPPLYLDLSAEQRDLVWRLAARLSQHVQTLVIDHHLLRCLEGLSWIRELSARTQSRVTCAAHFVGRRRRLLEAERARLYDEQPVPAHWHDQYCAGLAGTAAFSDGAD